MYKLDTAGRLLHFKACLYIQGDFQDITGLDVYTTIGVYYLLRILLALVAAFNLKCYLVNVTNAFLNAILDKEVYIKYPLGFKVRGYI